jgi:hypothetical protein
MKKPEDVEIQSGVYRAEIQRGEEILSEGEIKY